MKIKIPDGCDLNKYAGSKALFTKGKEYHFECNLEGSGFGGEIRADDGSLCYVLIEGSVSGCAYLGQEYNWEVVRDG